VQSLLVFANMTCILLLIGSAISAVISCLCQHLEHTLGLWGVRTLRSYALQYDQRGGCVCVFLCVCIYIRTLGHWALQYVQGGVCVCLSVSVSVSVSHFVIMLWSKIKEVCVSLSLCVCVYIYIYIYIYIYMRTHMLVYIGCDEVHRHLPSRPPRLFAGTNH
jgi:hypothetical protein